MTAEKKPAASHTSSQGNTSPATSQPRPAPQSAETGAAPELAPAPPAPTPVPTPTPSLVRKPAQNPAAAILLAREQQRMEANQAALQKLNASNLFYLRCPRERSHQAVYLLEYPVDSIIHPGMWFSIEHRPGDPWVHEGMRCQECLSEGDKHSWLWLRPHRMPDGQVAYTLAHPYGVKKDDDGQGAAHIYRISRSELEGRLGQTIEELFGLPAPKAAAAVAAASAAGASGEQSDEKGGA